MGKSETQIKQRVKETPKSPISLFWVGASLPLPATAYDQANMFLSSPPRLHHLWRSCLRGHLPILRLREDVSFTRRNHYNKNHQIDKNMAPPVVQNRRSRPSLHRYLFLYGNLSTQLPSPPPRGWKQQKGEGYYTCNLFH